MDNKFVEGYGPEDASIWCIGEAPGENEVLEGKPFVGSSGKFLRTKLAKAGVNPEKVRYENLIGVRPPDNKFSYFYSTPELVTQLDESISNLKSKIYQAKPKIVVCLGSQPLKFLMSRSDITKWRGHVEVINDIKYLATFHPSFCLRQFHSAENPGQAAALFGVDIKKAVRESAYPEQRIPPYKLLLYPSYPEAIEYLEMLKNEASIISFDIETAGLYMTCIGLSHKPDHACSIPMIDEYWKSSIERVEIFKRIKDLLESNIPKVAQNSQFDITVLKHVYKIDTKNLVWDTLVAAHNLYSDLPKDLGTLISLYTEMPYHKHLISEDRFYEYNALDALTALMIMNNQIKEMTEHKTIVHYRTVTNPLIKPLIDMQLVGVKVDVEMRDKAVAREERIQTDIVNALQTLFPKFNPGSGQQCKKLFYDTFKCRVIREKGKITTNKKALAKIASRDTRNIVKVLCEAIVKYKISKHLTGVLSTTLIEGRIHTAYSASGTDTGRLNSKESILGSGTNLQNLQKGLPRKMLVPG